MTILQCMIRPKNMFCVPGDYVAQETFTMCSHYFGIFGSMQALLGTSVNCSVVCDPIDSQDVERGERCMVSGLFAPRSRLKKVGDWDVLTEIPIQGDRWW